MKDKRFILCTGIMAAGYLVFSLAYYSQMYLLYNFFSSETVYTLSLGWAYIAQAAGMALFMLLYWKKPRIFSRRQLLVSLFALGAPLMCMTVLIQNAAVLVTGLVLTNLLCGINAAFTFTLTAAYVRKEHIGISFGTAYAIGSIGTWLISLLEPALMVSIHILPIACVLFGGAIALAFFIEDLPANRSDGEDDKTDRTHSLWYLIIVLVLMMLVSTLGSNSYSLITEDAGMSAIAARGFYAIGLLAAGFIYDKSRKLGAICTLASLVYPVIATVLYGQTELLGAVCAMSYLFLGFIAMYRAVSFMDLGAENQRLLPIVCGGLLLSRLVEAGVSLFNGALSVTPLSGLLLSGILFIPLIVVFCVMQIRQNAMPVQSLTEEMRLAAFSERYGLTGREEDVLQLLIHGASNGEIAAVLHLSESTVRFHSANIFKKTGCGGRVEVGRLYRQSGTDQGGIL